MLSNGVLTDRISRVKPILLDILVALSVLMLGLLALGFIGNWRIAVLHSSIATPGTWQVEDLMVQRGGVANYYTHGYYFPPGSAVPQSGFFFQHQIRVWPPRAPELRKSLWEFDARRPHSGPMTFIFGCPIWCAMVPFLIAPALWLRKRRRKPTIARGFAVKQTRPHVSELEAT